MLKDPRKVNRIVVAIFAIIFVSLAVATAKANTLTHKLAPPVPCTMANRIDIFIDEDDIMWECVCEALKTGHICHWQVVGGVESPAARKFLRMHPRARIYYKHHGYTIPFLLIKVPR